MDSKDVIRRLKQDGFRLARTKGSHQRFEHPDGRRVTIPHPKDDLPVGTLRNIFRQAGWDWESR